MNLNQSSIIGNLISNIGKKEIGREIDTLVKSLVSFDMSCAYLFRFNQKALLVHNGYNSSVPEKTLEAYVRGGYLLDPFYVACVNNHASGVWRMSELAPDSFFSSGFSISPDIHPCVSSDNGNNVDEVGYVLPITQHIYVVYSIMKNKQEHGFSSWDIVNLKQLFPVILSTLTLHCTHYYPDVMSAESQETILLEDAFFDILDGQLTDTQRYVAKLILQGHSSCSIAKNMKITEGTVKVHKHNIYQRLKISNNSDLLRLFIDYLTCQK